MDFKVGDYIIGLYIEESDRKLLMKFRDDVKNQFHLVKYVKTEIDGEIINPNKNIWKAVVMESPNYIELTIDEKSLRCSMDTTEVITRERFKFEKYTNNPRS